MTPAGSALLWRNGFEYLCDLSDGLCSKHAFTCGRLILGFHLPCVTRLPLTSPRRTCPRLCASSCWPTSGKRGETEKRTKRKMTRGSWAACPIRPSWSSRSSMWTEKCWTSCPPLTMKQVCVDNVPFMGVQCFWDYSTTVIPTTDD